MVAIEAPGEAPAPEASRIFISYKRDAELDRSLASFLHRSLADERHTVFLDVQISPGTDWQDVIAKEIRNSDFFVVLLSPASTTHGYVVEETVMARDSEVANGRPKIFPVRLAFTKGLPLRLSAAIGHLQHFEWRSGSDNDALLGTLRQAIGRAKGSDPQPTLLQRGDHFIVTGALWQSVGPRESISGTTIVPASPGQHVSLAATRAKGPGVFNVRLADDGGLEVAIWKSAAYRPVENRPGEFITMMEGDTHAWCFARYEPDRAVLLERRDGRKDPIVVTFDRDVVRAAWVITHQRGSDVESFLIAMKGSSST
jgi:hypothetical protein